VIRAQDYPGLATNGDEGPAVRAIMRAAIEACAPGSGERADYITVTWERRFTRRLGEASHAQQRIRFSAPLWARATVEERLQVVVHETCHLIARHIAPGDRPHGRVWQTCMRACGRPAERTHHIDRTGLARTQARVAAYCGCGERPLSQIRARRIARGQSQYTCLTCRQPVHLHQAPLPPGFRPAFKRWPGA